MYWQVRADGPAPGKRETGARLAAGIATAVAASAIFLVFGVHNWVGGDRTPWGASVLLGLCMGVCQGVLFRGRPWRGRWPRK